MAGVNGKDSGTVKRKKEVEGELNHETYMGDPEVLQ